MDYKNLWKNHKNPDTFRTIGCTQSDSQIHMWKRVSIVCPCKWFTHIIYSCESLAQKTNNHIVVQCKMTLHGKSLFYCYFSAWEWKPVFYPPILRPLFLQKREPRFLLPLRYTNKPKICFHVFISHVINSWTNIFCTHLLIVLNLQDIMGIDVLSWDNCSWCCTISGSRFTGFRMPAVSSWYFSEK